MNILFVVCSRPALHRQQLLDDDVQDGKRRESITSGLFPSLSVVKSLQLIQIATKSVEPLPFHLRIGLILKSRARILGKDQTGSPMRLILNGSKDRLLDSLNKNDVTKFSYIAHH